MEFLKNHYEKLILSLVLVGLAIAAGYLTFEVDSVRQSLAEVTGVIEDPPKVDPLPELNLSTNEAALSRVKGNLEFAFGTRAHGLFNPRGTWRRTVDGPKPPPPDGLEGLTVTNISPLLLTVEYQGATTAAGAVRYRFVVRNQASTNAAIARGRIITLAADSRPEVIHIKSFLGSAEDPESFQVELVDQRTTVTVAKEKPFSDVAGYAADMRYQNEGRNFPRTRVGSRLTIEGLNYNVVAISASEVTLEDDKTKRRTVIGLKSSP